MCATFSALCSCLPRSSLLHWHRSSSFSPTTIYTPTSKHTINYHLQRLLLSSPLSLAAVPFSSSDYPMASNQPSKLERTLSLTSEPRTLTKEQCELARAVASLHALEKQRVAGSNDADVKPSDEDADEGTSSAAKRVNHRGDA